MGDHNYDNDDECRRMTSLSLFSKKRGVFSVCSSEDASDELHTAVFQRMADESGSIGYNLLAYSSQYGLLFVGLLDAITVFSVASLEEHCQESDGSDSDTPPDITADSLCRFQLVAEEDDGYLAKHILLSHTSNLLLVLGISNSCQILSVPGVVHGGNKTILFSLPSPGDNKVLRGAKWSREDRAVAVISDDTLVVIRTNSEKFELARVGCPAGEEGFDSIEWLFDADLQKDLLVAAIGDSICIYDYSVASSGVPNLALVYRSGKGLIGGFEDSQSGK
jgi:hypothetical protein